MESYNTHTALLLQISGLELGHYAVVAYHNGLCCRHTVDVSSCPDTHKTPKHNARPAGTILVEKERLRLGEAQDRTQLRRERASAESCCWLHEAGLVVLPYLHT